MDGSRGNQTGGTLSKETEAGGAGPGQAEKYDLFMTLFPARVELVKPHDDIEPSVNLPLDTFITQALASETDETESNPTSAGPSSNKPTSVLGTYETGHGPELREGGATKALGRDSSDSTIKMIAFALAVATIFTVIWLGTSTL